MPEHDEWLAWMTLGRAPGLDAARLSAALEILGDPRALIGGSAAAWTRASIPAKTAVFLSSRAACPRAVERRWLESESHHLLPLTDSRYPDALRELPERPLLLYVSGNVAALADPRLAIVGSRNPTPAGRETAGQLAEALGRRGLAIVSGVAEGIDASAHQAALRAQTVTLGVLGTGIDLVYPHCNRRLHADLERYGLLLSAFPLGTAPRRANFPRRNRLIAGLSLGIVVVEAAARSGSLITAAAAQAFGRPVFAVPGPIRSPLSRGCHRLIREGATLVETAADILGKLNFSPCFDNDLRAPRAAAAPAPATSGMDKDHKILLDALGFEPVDLDMVVARTGFKPEAVSSMMLILELEGHVQAAPGGRYSRVVYRRAGGER